MIALLRSATPWLLGVLIGVAVYAGMQARQYAEQLSETEAQLTRAQERAEILLAHQQWQKRQMEQMTAALRDRDERLQREGELVDLMRQAARDLERTDAETADWADQFVPSAAREWLRRLPAKDGASAGDSDAGGAATPGGTTAGPESSGDDAQPGSTAAAR